jgi:hypothetical protein
MVKKFSYLVSVSVLASSLLSSASHAVFDDELRGVINSFRASQSQAHLPSQPASSSPSDDESSWWTTAYTAGNSILSGTGHTLRYLGDCVRGDSPVGDLLVDNALSLAKTAQYGGGHTAKFIDAVKAEPDAKRSFKHGSGNFLRWVGGRLAGETPTLERVIRQFWIDKRVVDIEEVFTSTACALYSSQVEGVDEIKLNYRKFTTAWNSSSYTVPSLDAGKNVEYFLKGIIRGFVMNGQSMSNFDLIAPQMAALGITYKNLPATKAITVDKLPQETRKARVAQERQEAFMGFVGAIYDIESIKKQADQARAQARLTSLQSASSIPSADPASPPLLAIEYYPSDASPSVGENQSDASNTAVYEAKPD